MRFSVHLCQRKFLHKHLRHSHHVSHVSFILPLVSKIYAPRFCHIRTSPASVSYPYPITCIFRKPFRVCICGIYLYICPHIQRWREYMKRILIRVRCICFCSNLFTSLSFLPIPYHMYISQTISCVYMWYIFIYLSSYSEVKRVYDVYQYIFSGEESMCWTCIIYSLSIRLGSLNRLCRYGNTYRMES
jgi:hypothetical protein